MSATNRAKRSGEKTLRQANDHYETPPWCVDAIAPHIGYLNGHTSILDPCCGKGALLNVIGSQYPCCKTIGIEIDEARAIHARHHGPKFRDVLWRDALTPGAWPKAELVITNPPYSHAEAFVRRAFEECVPIVCMLLRLNFLGSKKRAAFWKDHPADIFVLPKRPSFTGSGTDATEYAWFLWGGKGNHWWILDV